MIYAGNEKGYCDFINCFPIWKLFGQQMPFNPVSYRIFSPFILNPAIAGSKDYMSFDVLAGFNGKSNSQVASGNARIARKTSGYGTSGRIYSYTNIGAGVLRL